ncbi:RagB/SusD family nutrient uptake outer membrane protein [Sphingobacterium haloxyli]|uniref:RagB/SusD family nutrient uptake outer membrane protein n=1 Tax=Sphingobacterium haloxyli TaxID=2100533 RepID=A0A2S9J2F3_9SPHI|nr:RagB/SusD family nutrient uptake outer membrane protein [Sphingobacterium haloxyli]PRD46967.1 RagB/SusD family nutrient uptake outer membrane protein [Sphingobacterium haloxyli]
MRTKNIVFALMCAGLFGTSSCSSFLEEGPRAQVTLSDFYQNEAQALENVTTLYRMGAPVRYGVASSAYIGPTASINSFLTGYFSNDYEGQELISMYSRQLTRQQNIRIVSNTMNGIWADSYRAINVANGAIKHIPNIGMPENTQRRLVAEAKFFRAFNYFYLVKTFGAIPFPTEPYESLDNVFLPRTPEEQIYALMEEDLREAVEILPDALFTNNGFRVTRYVAAMALANVYLQQGKYADAATSIREVTNSAHALAQHDDLALGSAYNKLRTEDNLTEAIYSYEFNETISNSGRWPGYAFSSSATAVFGTYAIFERVFGPTNRFLNVYEDDDLRIQPNQFYHWEYTNPENGRTWRSATAGIWYYHDEEAVLRTGIGTKDWNIYRYAEALLIAAEAIAKSESVTAEAAGYLAEIKARADMNGKDVASYITELQRLSPDEFVKEVWRERLRELPLEFKMWDDCLRTRMFPVVSATEKGTVDFVPLIGAQSGSGATFKESDLLWPISMDELQRNPELTPTEGYQY